MSIAGFFKSLLIKFFEYCVPQSTREEFYACDMTVEEPTNSPGHYTISLPSRHRLRLQVDLYNEYDCYPNDSDLEYRYSCHPYDA
ncbi:hypothetical protein CFE70_000399 [Pyrenophora teres f. teres 0-1]